jgi:hypothetical protein
MTWEVETYTGLTSVAANAAEASRTLVINLNSHGRYRTSALLVYSLTRVAATAMTVQLYKSADGGTTYGRVPSLAISAGTGTASDYTVSKAVSGSDTMAIDVDVSNCTHLKAIFAATTGGADDKITITASAGGEV